MLVYPESIYRRNLFFYFKSFETNPGTQILYGTIVYLSKLPKYLMNRFSSVLYTMKGYQCNVLVNAVSVLIL